MKYGLSFLPDASPERKPAKAYFEEAIALSVLAEELGFSTIKMTEHYLHPYGGYCPSPLIFLSTVAAKTKTIRLMTGCILPAFHHPIQIAAHTALVDVISGGRLDVGFGRAYLPYEFAAFGVDLDDSRDRYTKTILAVQELWQKPHCDGHSEFFQYTKATSYPSPIQTPHPPVWGAAVNSRQSFAWLGEQGFNLLISPPLGKLENILPLIDIYRSTYVEHHKESAPQVAISLPLLINESEETAIRQSDLYLASYLNTWAGATQEWDHTTSSDYPKYTGMAKILRAYSPQAMRQNGSAIVGSPQSVLDKVESLTRLLQVDQILWQIDYGCQPYEVSKKSLELFYKYVIPFLPQAESVCQCK